MLSGGLGQVHSVNPMGRFSRADIEDSFDEKTIRRGEEYIRAGRVLEVGIAPDGVVMAAVEGSEVFPYSVRLIQRGGSKPHIEGHCTCPVEVQCKHCAAAALAWGELVADDPQDELDVKLPPQLVDWLGTVAHAEPDPGEIIEGAKYRTFYVVTQEVNRYFAVRTHIRAMNRSVLKNGDFGTATDVKAASIDNRQFAKHFNTYDRRLLLDLSRNAGREDWAKANFRLEETHGERLLRITLKSGRCTWESPDGPLLHEAPPRTGRIVWTSDRKGEQAPRVEIDGGGVALTLNPPWYVDSRSGECGPIDCGMSPGVAFALLSAPGIAPEYADGVRKSLARLGVPSEAIPAEPMPVERLEVSPTPHLAVEMAFCEPVRFESWRRDKRPAIPIPFARLTFRYGDVQVAPSEKSEIRQAFKDRIRIIPRDARFESDCESALLEAGWESCRYLFLVQVPQGKGTWLGMGPEESGDTSYLESYRDFLQTAAPRLRERGWVIEAPEDFRVVAEDAIEWDVGIDDVDANDWFEFKLAVRIDGKEVPLRPILLQLLAAETPAIDRYGRKIQSAKVGQTRHVTIDGGLVVSLSPDRVRKLLQPLVELFGDIAQWPDVLSLPKSRLTEAEAFAEAAEFAGLPWKTPPELAALSQRLKAFGHLEPMGEPPGFKATLRDYQREGLAWLQFLQEYDFGGILADDMGLGKTVQVLAHIQTEKLAGRLDRPCLVVAPTSTLPNWRREAERFAPDLRVLVHHGTKRKDSPDTLSSSDIVVTNYALLARDRAELIRQPFHLVVLDEAQNIKNSTTAAAKAARDLNARHRLCLSGTPIENHLDELWSLFHFLMPGFLGSATQFRQKFRVRIEQHGDAAARSKLGQMVRPFMLRRTKQEVVKELPPKTEILETVELGDAQRDLYETIRLAMDEKVRSLLAAQGLSKSRIQVLDALLKLRQVCCDPRLVKLPAAKSVTESAKLDRLMEMISVLIEDGRKILLFSQFTSMLDLIQPRLRELGIEWVRITGDTQDRDTPVRRFEAGEAPLFLISLKAGGTGLNLVAADTVIHYDPWWNPAVENQATDRAYRIGQDKPVMVYKLVVAGTVEEKILDLQRRKGDLAASILSETDRAESILDSADLEWLFAANQT